jgi:flagellar biosynthesis protein FliP
VRSAKVPRRVLFFAVLIATAGSLIDPAFAQDISINLGQGSNGGGGLTERVIQLIAFVTVL